MRLVVLDTNVIVSAGNDPRGAPAAIVMEGVLEGRVQVVSSPYVAREYVEVTRRARSLRYRFPPAWLEFLLAESLALDDPPPWPRACPDPDDAPFLALAAVSGAWLVTGNLKHFPRAARGKVSVVSPADYLAHLRASEA
ncbi:MAG: PIN domain-containing protein [Deltaproteobacteria bacterium]|nr:PIN domain-containing protein [Deltaproteobacteria bacterium]